MSPGDLSSTVELEMEEVIVPVGGSGTLVSCNVDATSIFPTNAMIDVEVSGLSQTTLGSRLRAKRTTTDGLSQPKRPITRTLLLSPQEWCAPFTAFRRWSFLLVGGVLDMLILTELVLIVMVGTKTGPLSSCMETLVVTASGMTSMMSGLWLLVRWLKVLVLLLPATLTLASLSLKMVHEQEQLQAPS